MKEEWRDVIGYEGYYEVSNMGRVRSRSREVVNAKGKPCPPFFMEGRVLAQAVNQDGYLKVGLSVRGKLSTHSVHTLVAKAFLGIRPEGLQVNHKDEDRTNNCVSNLEWVTCKENCNYGSRNKKVSDWHKKPVVSIDANGGKKWYPSAKDASKEGFNTTLISLCAQGKNKTHKGLRWEFAL